MKYCKVAIFMLLMAVFIAVPLSHADYEDSLKSYWKMDNNFSDSTLTGHDGTGYGGTNYVSGRFDQASNFDGINDYISVGDSDDWDFGSGNFAINFWIRPSDLVTTNQMMVGQVESSNYAPFRTDLNGKSACLLLSSDGTNWATGLNTGNVITSTDAWYNLAFVRDGSNISIYVNGDKEAETTFAGTLYNSSRPLSINSNGSGYYFYEGLIDDVAIWSRSLDDNEMGMIYDLGTEKFEWLSLGVNNTDKLNLGYTTEELAILAQLYADGKAGLDPDSLVVGDNNWTYLSGDLPGDIGGTTYDVGDSWIYDGKYYIKLGSGLEGGAVPEIPPFAAQGMVLAFGSVSIWVRRRRVKVSADNAMLL